MEQACQDAAYETVGILKKYVLNGEIERIKIAMEIAKSYKKELLGIMNEDEFRRPHRQTDYQKEHKEAEDGG
jgi:hypothetical protein